MPTLFDMPTLFFVFGFIWLMSILTFAVYGFDKHQAYYAKFRIPEFLLIILALAGGAFGALMAMWFFRHKIRKPLFYITVPLLVIAMTIGSLFVDFPYNPTNL